MWYVELTVEKHTFVFTSHEKSTLCKYETMWKLLMLNYMLLDMGEYHVTRHRNTYHLIPANYDPCYTKVMHDQCSSMKTIKSWCTRGSVNLSKSCILYKTSWGESRAKLVWSTAWIWPTLASPITYLFSVKMQIYSNLKPNLIFWSPFL